MPDNTKTTFASHSKNYAFAIPAAADTPLNLYDWADANVPGFALLDIVGAGLRPCASDYRASNDVTLNPFYLVPAGDGFSERTNEFLRDTWVRADIGAAISAVLVIYWK